MIVVLKHTANQNDIDNLIFSLERLGVQPHVSYGTYKTIIEILGDATHIDPNQILSLEFVESVLPISKPIQKVSRDFQAADSVIDCGFGCKIGGNHFQIIAGPCAVESKTLFPIAQAVHESGAHMLRAGAYKPRTSPYSYQGMGKQGLALLSETREEFQMPIVTEIVDVRDINTFLEYNIDVLQVGARNCQNFSLLKELGRIDKPILLKRGPATTLDELLQAAEYILSGGNNRVILCERGIRGFDSHTRNIFDVSSICVLHDLTHLPVIADPSHATGHAKYVSSAALAATAAGCNGLEIEVHTNPNQALSDPEQALTPNQFRTAVKKIFAVRSALYH